MSDTYILTKKEIGDAIVNYISIFREGKLFYPYYISETDQELHIPESVMFHLDYIPKGTREIEHAI